MRSTERITLGSSLEVAAARLRETAYSVIPVTDGQVLVGVISEASLREALGNGASAHSASDSAIVPAQTVPPYVTGADALRQLESANSPDLVVIDDSGQVLGMIAASDLFPQLPVMPHMPMVGGMATPFGVYLTTGTLAAGASGFGLLLTGAMLFIIFTATTVFGLYLEQWTGAKGWAAYAVEWAPLVLFLCTIRLIPLAGTHGAEHQVVHALERGEPLVPEVVSRMPRVHPRCGTNLAVGMSIFIGLATWKALGDEETRLMIAAMVTLFTWRSVGAVVQQYITTKKPNLRQTKQAIAAAEQLIYKYQTARRTVPSLPLKLYYSGMFHVIGGSTAAYFLLLGISKLLHIELPI